MICESERPQCGDCLDFNIAYSKAKSKVREINFILFYLFLFLVGGLGHRKGRGEIKILFVVSMGSAGRLRSLIDYLFI